MQVCIQAGFSCEHHMCMHRGCSACLATTRRALPSHRHLADVVHFFCRPPGLNVMCHHACQPGVALPGHVLYAHCVGLLNQTANSHKHIQQRPLPCTEYGNWCMCTHALHMMEACPAVTIPSLSQLGLDTPQGPFAPHKPLDVLPAPPAHTVTRPAQLAARWQQLHTSPGQALGLLPYGIHILSIDASCFSPWSLQRSQTHCRRRAPAQPLNHREGDAVASAQSSLD
jgi:hypothetical protein